MPSSPPKIPHVLYVYFMNMKKNFGKEDGNVFLITDNITRYVENMKKPTNDFQN